MANEKPRPPVCGSIHAATGEGFKALLEEANRVASDGYDLVTVVRLDKGIAGIFRRPRQQVPGEPKGSFFE